MADAAPTISDCAVGDAPDRAISGSCLALDGVTPICKWDALTESVYCDYQAGSIPCGPDMAVMFLVLDHIDTEKDYNAWGTCGSTGGGLTPPPFCCDIDDPIGEVRRIGIASGTGDDILSLQYPLPDFAAVTAVGNPFPYTPPAGFYSLNPVPARETFGFDGLAWGRSGNDIILGSHPRPGPVLDYREFLYGAENDDVIVGFGGLYDSLDGGPGSDWLNGGVGVDYFNGGGGRDFIQGREDGDVAFGSGGADLICGDLADLYLPASYASPQPTYFRPWPLHDAAGFALTCDQSGAGWDDDLQGNEGDDKVIGGGGVDVVRGGEDNDIVCAEEGEVYGGGGDDALYLETLTGVRIYTGGTGNNDCYGPNVTTLTPPSSGCSGPPPLGATIIGTCPL